MTKDSVLAKTRRGWRFYRACRAQDILPHQVWPWTMAELHLLRESRAKELLVTVRRRLLEIDPQPSSFLENIYTLGLHRGKQYRVRRNVGPNYDRLYFDVEGFGVDKKSLAAGELTIGEMNHVIALAKHLRPA